MANTKLESLTTSRFIVPVGELECWLKDKGAKGHGPDWLLDLFSKIGNSEEDENYLKSDTDDVWSLLDSMVDYAKR